MSYQQGYGEPELVETWHGATKKNVEVISKYVCQATSAEAGEQIMHTPHQEIPHV